VCSYFHCSKLYRFSYGIFGRSVWGGRSPHPNPYPLPPCPTPYKRVWCCTICPLSPVVWGFRARGTPLKTGGWVRVTLALPHNPNPSAVTLFFQPLSSEYGTNQKSRPYSGLGFQIKVLESFQVVPSSLGGGLDPRPVGIPSYLTECIY